MDISVSRSESSRHRAHPGRELTARAVFLRASVPILILVAGVAAFWFLSERLRTEPPTVAATVAELGVTVATVRDHAEGMVIEADGVVVPFREIHLAAEVGGRVAYRAAICRAGNFVTRGTLLARIDPQDYQLDKDRLTVEKQQAAIAIEELAEEIAGAEELIEISQQQVELRAKELQRLRGLGRAVSTSDVDLAEVSELTARNALLTLRNQLRLMRIRRTRLEAAQELAATRLAKAELDLKRTEVIAPIDGVIVADHIEQDAFVQPGTTLLTLEDTSHVEVKCRLEMESLFWLWDAWPTSGTPGTPGEDGLSVHAYAIPPAPVQVVYRLAGQGDREYVWDGVLSRYDGLGLDEKTRTVPCRVMVEEPLRRAAADTGGPPALVRGMYVTVRIQVEPRTALLRIPETALQPGNVVYRVRDQELAIVPVRFVRVVSSPATDAATTTAALIYVEDPDALTAGDQVVVSQLAFVRSGMEVAVFAESEGEE
jgi:multidrug resistance efflux pump